MKISTDAEAPTIDPLMFYLTGKQPSSGKDALAGARPALLAAFRDLTKLRYDYPLVLIEGQTAGAPVRSLMNLIDDLLQKIAPPGMESEQLRKMILRIEREIRVLAASGEDGLLSQLWDVVAARLEQADEVFGKSAHIARAALEVDGRVLDCRADTANALIEHLWSAVQEEKAKKFRTAVSRLAVKLADILRADHLHSPGGRSSESLRATIGTPHQALFDFSAMSSLLLKSSPRQSLSVERRRRIESALATLKAQRFFAAAAGQARPEPPIEPHSFRFTDVGDALAAHQARLPEMVELVKAMAIAELEIDGNYVEGRHDVIFAGYDAGSLSEQDLALFPDYLVTLATNGAGINNAGLMAALSSGVPLKILLNIDDVLGDAAAGNGRLASGLHSAQLAGLATGLGDVFIVQTTCSNLYPLAERLFRGLGFGGPSLFAVFSAAPTANATLPLYLNAAAAMQSRAFPAFSYDPSAGADMASRFSLEDNPQPEADWSIHEFEYGDAEMRRAKQNVAFTAVDYLLCDSRYHRHFIAAPRNFGREHMVLAEQRIAASSAENSETVPYVFMADVDDRLSRAIVDEKAIAAARRCLESWHRLQELGGIHNSYAARLVAREKEAWEERRRKEMQDLQAPAQPPAPAPSPAPTPAAAPPVAQPEASVPEHSPDEAYIETERCSTCNECTLINDRMFAYNANRQAYIADIKAGTYAQIVEAAESCQLGIIHPGKPINASEPGLDELLKRAEPFQ